MLIEQQLQEDLVITFPDGENVILPVEWLEINRSNLNQEVSRQASRYGYAARVTQMLFDLKRQADHKVETMEAQAKRDLEEAKNQLGVLEALARLNSREPLKEGYDIPKPTVNDIDAFVAADENVISQKEHVAKLTQLDALEHMITIRQERNLIAYLHDQAKSYMFALQMKANMLQTLGANIRSEYESAEFNL